MVAQRICAHGLSRPVLNLMRDDAILAEYFCLNLDEETRAQVEALAKRENVTPQQMSLILLREALFCDSHLDECHEILNKSELQSSQLSRNDGDCDSLTFVSV